MEEYPHHYRVAASTGSEGDVNLTSSELDPILSAPPAEFDGPGDLWSPETLLVAAVADCFILSFKLSWVAIFGQFQTLVIASSDQSNT